jgi:hypothetical protein
MAVRRKKAEGGDSSSLDSLMDALTNVVAVLIFVLLLVNCDVAQTVVKIMEDIVPVSEEEMRQAQEMLKQIDLDAKKLEELKKQPQPSKLEFEELQKALEALKKLKDEKLKKIEAHGGEMAELQRRHDESQAARDTEQQKNVAMQEEIRRLEILLDTTPVEKDIPATDITIPANRPIPEGAKIHYAYIVGDRAYFLDLPKYMEDATKIVDDLKKDKNNHMPTEEKAEEEEDKKLSAAERRAKREQEKAEAKKEKPIVLNRDKALPVLYEKLGKLMAPGLNYAVIAQPWWGFARLDISFNDKGGATIEELKQPTNSFASALSKLRPPNDVLMFRVDPPCMYAYALAREIADKKGIPCGWELTLPGECFSRTDIPNLAINATGVAPARDPNWKPPERARGTGPKLD